MKKLLLVGMLLLFGGLAIAQQPAKKPVCHHIWVPISYEFSFDSIDWTKVHSVETIAKLLHNGTCTVTKVMCSKCGEVRDLADIAVFTVPPLPTTDVKGTGPATNVKK